MKLSAITMGLAAVVTGGSACAMTSPPAHAVSCSVVGADKLPAEIGGADAVCDAIREAVGAHGATVVVKVTSESAATAAVTTPDGNRLPAIGVTISDRAFNRHSIDMLAAEIARQLAGSN